MLFPQDHRTPQRHQMSLGQAFPHGTSWSLASIVQRWSIVCDRSNELLPIRIFDGGEVWYLDINVTLCLGSQTGGR